MMMMITSRHQGEDQEYQMNGVEGEAGEEMKFKHLIKIL